MPKSGQESEPDLEDLKNVKTDKGLKPVGTTISITQRFTTAMTTKKNGKVQNLFGHVKVALIGKEIFLLVITDENRCLQIFQKSCFEALTGA